jgi:hypothetical protein
VSYVYQVMAFATLHKKPCHIVPGLYATSENSVRRSSQNMPQAYFRLCEVALLGHRPRSAGHGSRARVFYQLWGFVTTTPISTCGHYSPECVEEEFSEVDLPLNGVLGS